MGFEFKWPWEEGRIFGYKGPFWKFGEAITYPGRALGILPAPAGEPTVGIPALTETATEKWKEIEAEIRGVEGFVREKIEVVESGAKAVLTPIVDLTETATGLTEKVSGLSDTVTTFVQSITTEKLKELVPSFDFKMPDIKMPDISVLMPEIKMPEISVATGAISLWPVALLGLAIAGVAILG